MDERGVIITISATIIAMLLISIGFIAFIIMFHRSKRKAIELQQAMQLEHVRDLAELEHEIRDGAMHQIGMELHDGVVQELTLVKLHLSQARRSNQGPILDEAEKVLLETIKDVRNLARSMNSRRLRDIGLKEALQEEMDRLALVSGITTEFNALGEYIEIGEKAKIVVVRIAQEFFQNSLKHASPTVLGASVMSEQGVLKVKLFDNGSGFDLEGLKANDKSGIHNMQTRARSVGAKFTIRSFANEGTHLTLELQRHG